MTENYIYAPAHNIEGGFRCKVPLPGSRQIFMIDGGVQGTGRPLDIRFRKGEISEETLQVIGIRTEKHPEDISFASSYHFEEGSSAKLILCSHTFAENPFRTDERISITMEAEPRQTCSSCRTNTTRPRTTPASTYTWQREHP